VLGAGALAVLGLVVFGSGRLLAKRYPYVMYFGGSVSGLTVGAPVEMRGVKVGSVTDVLVTLDEKDLRVRIPVFVELAGSAIPKIGSETESEQVIRELVRRGMRAQLQTRSLVTGLVFIELNLHPDAPAGQVSIDPVTQLPEIPTVPSTLQQVFDAARTAIDDIAKLPLEEIVVSLTAALDGINELVRSPELRGAVGNLNDAVVSTQALIEDARQALRDPQGRVVPLAATASGTLAQMEATLRRIEEALSITAEGSPLRYELSAALQQVGEAARSLRALADALARNPEALVRGRSGGP
jgi:paraquat-inducible protein B